MEELEPYAKWMLVIFIIGYSLIILEHVIKIDKAAIALLMGVGCWTIQTGTESCDGSLACLGEHIGNISQIVFFLLGALAIVEIMNAHQGFSTISKRLRIHSKRKLLWSMGLLTFLLSGILDNLTTTVVMITLLQRLVDRGQDRLIIGGAVVIAANAGGAWTPIGDVTTTMLWIGGQVSTWPIIRDLFFPSLAALAVALFLLSFSLAGDFSLRKMDEEELVGFKGHLVFLLGIASLVFVPIFKMITGLPPFMGILFGLSILWLVTDLMYSKNHSRDHLRMPYMFTKMDFSGLLFFFGILLAIDALDSAHILEKLAQLFDQQIGNKTFIATLIGLVSAVIDNVPLVAATIGMYSLEQYPTDNFFWQLVAFCAGTGGSILIIGSAAGVVFMGLEKVNFYWYLKRISLPALLSYLAGILVYSLLS